MNFKEEGVVKSVAVFMCFILVVAIMGWTMPLVVGQDADADVKQLSDEGLDKITDFFKGGKSLPNIVMVIKDGEINAYYGGDSSVSMNIQMPISLGKINLEDLADELGAVNGIDVKDGIVTVKIGSEIRSFSLNRDDIPSDLESIQINDKGEVLYVMKGDNPGVVSVNQPGVTLVTNDDGKTVLKGALADKEKDIIVGLGENGEINVDDTGISYKGKGTTLKVGDNFFQASEGKKGSVNFAGGDGNTNFAITDSIVENNKNRFEGTVFIGDAEKAKKVEGFDKRYLNFDTNGQLTGDLSGLDKNKKESVKFRPKEKDVKMMGENIGVVEGGTLNAPKGEQITFNKNEKGDGTGEITSNVMAHTGSFSGTSISNAARNTNVGTPNEPNLPTTPPTGGTNDSGTTPITPPPVTPPPISPPGFGGPGGPGGGSNWLMWALIIGGAVLAAMFLLGGKKDKGGEKQNDGIDDGGEPYMGKDNDTDVTKEIRSKEGQDDKTIIYSPTPKVGGCTYDAEGYKNCPDDDCSKCGIGTRPLIQGVDDNEDDGTGKGDGDL